MSMARITPAQKPRGLASTASIIMVSDRISTWECVRTARATGDAEGVRARNRTSRGTLIQRVLLAKNNMSLGGFNPLFGHLDMDLKAHMHTAPDSRRGLCSTAASGDTICRYRQYWLKSSKIC